MARRQFAFLRQPLQVVVADDSVTITFADGNAAALMEAEKLADRAAKRASEGDYPKAISLWKRVLELNPLLHKARRDLAMASAETGDVDGAKNHLIELLRLNPADAWGWVVLGNLYAGQPTDWPTAEKFFRRALDIDPADPWALTGLATITAQRGQTEPALKLFEQAIAAKPDLPNPHHGLALTHYRASQHERAGQSLDRMFANSRPVDARSKVVYDNARQLYGAVQAELAPRQHPDAFKVVENFRAEMEQASGFPVRVTEDDFPDTTLAVIQMAWKHGRNHHVVKVRTGTPDPLRCHLLAHELTHLQLEAEARSAGKNRFFSTTGSTDAFAAKRIQNELLKLERRGLPANTLSTMTRQWIHGTANFLFNCPLDMVIETRLRERMPALAAAQFVSLRTSVADALQSNTNPEVRQLTPPLILRASLALNGAYALFVDQLYRGATAYAASYQREEAFSLSQRLFRLWQSRSAQLGPGDEYTLVEEFADLLGLRGWFEWCADPGSHEITGTQPTEGTTNPDLLRKKQMPAVFYCLDALKRFNRLPVEKIRDVAFEIGIVGQSGLDYASPDAKYALKSLPGEKFTGLHLMCLMFAGFKRIAPEHDLHMDLEEPFLIALETFQKDPPGTSQ